MRIPCIAAAWRRTPTLPANRSGVVGILFALAMPILVGFTALGIEVGLWYLERRELQMAADAAAVSAAYEILHQNSDDTVTGAARLEVEQHGFDPDVGSFVVSHPPATGANTANADAVEVSLTQPRSLLIARMFLGDAISISARAVAVPNPSGVACVLSLDPSAAAAVAVSGSGTVDMPGCVVASNSSDAAAIELQGNGTLTAQSLSTPGGFSKVGNAGSLNVTEAIRTGTTALSNPYADLAVPSHGACDVDDYSTGDSGGGGKSPKKSGDSDDDPPQPGTVYCGGMKFGSQANVDFTPGTYIIVGGTFDVSGGATLTCSACTGGNGVTFVLTGSGSDYAGVSINGNGVVDLSAPSGGALPGMLFFQDPAAPSGAINRFNGNATMKLHGALYFPNQKVDFRGNSTVAEVTCTQIVAAQVEFSGSSAIGSDCDNTGVQEINAGGTISLIE